MSTTRGVRTLVGAALASSVILLGGCSSSGTTSGSTGGSNPLAGGSTHSSAGSTGGTSGGSSSSDSSGSTGGSSSSSSSSDNSGTTGGSSGGSGNDAGCQAATSDVANGPQALSGLGSNKTAAIAAIKGIGDKLHADAGKSSGAAASAINKLADDYIGLANSVQSGKMPDTNSLISDATAMATACGA